MVGDVLPSVCLNGGDVYQEASGHTDQGLCWPGVEPVKGGAVDQGRELARPDAELVTHRAETQHHVQVLAHLRPSRHELSIAAGCHVLQDEA